MSINNMKKLKEFGAGSTAIEYGYDLELLVGWIEDLINTEAEKVNDSKSKINNLAYERLSKAEDALQSLHEVLEY